MTRDREPDDEVTQDVDAPDVAPMPEATGTLPLSISPTGAPAALGTPVDAPAEETSRLALWIGLAIVVLVVAVALIVWL
jgi:hypothetical protein